MLAEDGLNIQSSKEIEPRSKPSLKRRLWAAAAALLMTITSASQHQPDKSHEVIDPVVPSSNQEVRPVVIPELPVGSEVRVLRNILEVRPTSQIIYTTPELMSTSAQDNRIDEPARDPLNPDEHNFYVYNPILVSNTYATEHGEERKVEWFAFADRDGDMFYITIDAYFHLGDEYLPGTPVDEVGQIETVTIDSTTNLGISAHDSVGGEFLVGTVINKY